MSATEDSIDSLSQALHAFAAARDWEQFHSPKNLSMALAGECGEVLEHFQWLTQEASAALNEQQTREVGLELADVFIYTVRLADTLGIDLLAAARAKMAINESRYPVERVRGDARRASQYANPAPQAEGEL
ncbi:MAG: nucleotide pyrophosphohydrolase [Gammaproteobacteria bacterium]|nr:nucleotide pyrophosphohydrolase [Gammaproteobacteria bacterium]